MTLRASGENVRRSGISVPGWFLSVVVLVSSIIGAGVTIGSQVEKMRADLRERDRAFGTRLCRIEYAVGLMPSKACDVSEFLIPRDDAHVKTPPLSSP